MKLARGFSRQHRIIHFTTIGSASGLRHKLHGFTCTTSYTLTPGQPPPGLDYLPASPHHLPTTTSVQRLHHSPQLRRDQGGFTALALEGSMFDASQRVPEYQPVIHRLRLWASPYVPTYPGQSSLTQEPLVNRRTRFSRVYRYSCLHSHS